MNAASRLVLVLALLGSLGCGEERERSPAEAAGDRRPNADGVLPCTDKDEPTNFDAYSVGRSFEGLPLVHQGRTCTHAPRIAPPQVRINSVDYVYGRCEQEEGGCATPTPLQIQSWPRCERGFSEISSGELTIRGVPARYQGGGLALLTGDAMVAIFANDRGRALRAARALVKAPARPSDPVTEARASSPLPPPKPPAPGCGRHAQARPTKRRHSVPSHEPRKLPVAPSEAAGGPASAFPPAPVHTDGDESSRRGRARAERVRANQRRLERIRGLPKTRQAGCERAVFPLARPRSVWGPPRPRIVAARRTASRATIRFEFERLPRSPACRPHFLTVRITTGKLDTRSFRISDRIFRVLRASGSATLSLPRAGRPPYTVAIQAVTLDGRPAQPVKALLR